jgi:hypothetical protein
MMELKSFYFKKSLLIICTRNDSLWWVSMTGKYHKQTCIIQSKLQFKRNSPFEFKTPNYYWNSTYNNPTNFRFM